MQPYRGKLSRAGSFLLAARRPQPGPPVAVPGQMPGGLRPAVAGVRVVFGRVRHGGFEGRKGPIAGTFVILKAALCTARFS